MPLIEKRWGRMILSGKSEHFYDSLQYLECEFLNFVNYVIVVK